MGIIVTRPPWDGHGDKAVSGFYVERAGADSVALRWDEVEGASGYKVQHSDDGESWTDYPSRAEEREIVIDDVAGAPDKHWRIKPLAVHSAPGWSEARRVPREVAVQKTIGRSAWSDSSPSSLTVDNLLANEFEEGDSVFLLVSYWRTSRTDVTGPEGFDRIASGNHPETTSLHFAVFHGVLGEAVDSLTVDFANSPTNAIVRAIPFPADVEPSRIRWWIHRGEERGLDWFSPEGSLDVSPEDSAFLCWAVANINNTITFWRPQQKDGFNWAGTSVNATAQRMGTRIPYDEEIEWRPPDLDVGGDRSALMGAFEVSRLAARRAEPSPDWSGVLASELDQVPGYGWCVYRHGEKIAEGYEGQTRKEGAPSPSPVDWQASTLAPIASVTKTLAVAATIKLAERGLLSLDDLFAEHIKASDYYISGEIRESVTVRHLLRQRVDPANGSGDSLNTTLEGKESDLQDWLASGLDSLAGTRRAYHNTTFDVLQLVIESITGEPYFDTLQELVLDPLGIAGDVVSSTPQDSLLAHRADGSGSGVSPDFPHSPAAYSLWATVEAIAKFFDAINGLIPGPMFRAMRSDELRFRLARGERGAYSSHTGGITLSIDSGIRVGAVRFHDGFSAFVAHNAAGPGSLDSALIDAFEAEG